jgi:hypothetical protein
MLPCTGCGAIWRIWSRFCNIRASYLARFPVSRFGYNSASEWMTFLLLALVQTPDARIQGIPGIHELSRYAVSPRLSP